MTTDDFFKLTEFKPVGLIYPKYPCKLCSICNDELIDLCMNCVDKNLDISCPVIISTNTCYHEHCKKFIDEELDDKQTKKKCQKINTTTTNIDIQTISTDDLNAMRSRIFGSDSPNGILTDDVSTDIMNLDDITNRTIDLTSDTSSVTSETEIVSEYYLNAQNAVALPRTRQLASPSDTTFRSRTHDIISPSDIESETRNFVSDYDTESGSESECDCVSEVELG